MLTTHKISADFYDEDFQFIAIHSGLEDFAMGYAINSNCGLNLKRMKKDLQLERKGTFSVFEWNDEMTDTEWMLFSNKCTVEEVVPATGFFENNTSFRIMYLIPEYREVDFFLKVDSAEPKTEYAIKAINKLPKVVTAYEVDTQTLRSKRNLIF